MEPPGKIPSQKFCDHINILGEYRPHFITTHQYFSDVGVERALCCPRKERRGQTKFGQ